jgi:hypothetical protein
MATRLKNFISPLATKPNQYDTKEAYKKEAYKYEVV